MFFIAASYDALHPGANIGLRSPMTEAILLIALVAFVGRLVISAAALRNWWMAAAICATALSIYIVPAFAGFSVKNGISKLHAQSGAALPVVLAALGLAIGFAAPTFLARAERRDRRWTALAVFVGVVAAVFIVDLWRIEEVALFHRFLSPHFWFVIGVVLFVIFESSFFERGPAGSGPEEWRDPTVSESRRRGAG